MRTEPEASSSSAKPNPGPDRPAPAASGSRRRARWLLAGGACVVVLAAVVAAFMLGRRHDVAGGAPRAQGSPTAASAAALAPPAGPGAPARTGTETPASFAVASGELEKLLRAYQKLPDAADRSWFDLKARAASLRGIEDAFAFVRDGIANEVYPGVLRGGDGALAAGAGNDADKALLLAALLREQQRRVRFARGVLDERRAAERVRALFAPRPPSARPGLDSPLRAALRQEGFDDARTDGLLNSRASVLEASDRTVLATAAQDLAAVREALDRAGIPVKPAASGDIVAREARTHIWLQVEDAGRWLDLDPAFPGPAGTSYCGPAATFDVLPNDAYQQITFTIRLDRSDGGRLVSERSFSRTFRAEQLHGRPVFFMNLPAPGDTAPDAPPDMTWFAPVLFAADAAFVGNDFRTAPGRVQAQDVIVGGLFGASGPAPLVVAQWLDIELIAPGRRQVVSRAIADTVEPGARAARQAKAVASQDLTIFGIQLGQPLAIAVSGGGLDAVQTAATAFAGFDAAAAGRAFAAPAGAEAALQADVVANVLPLLAATSLKFALASDETIRGGWTSGYAHSRIYRDQPLIVMANFAVRRHADGTKVVGGLSVDFRHNMVRVVPESPEAVAEAFWMNVHHGLADGALERHVLALARIAKEQRGAADAAEEVSTSSLAARARERGIDLSALEGENAVRTLQSDFAAAGGYRLASDVGPGKAIIMPARPVEVGGENRSGGWVVDLRSGHAIALVDSGLRQDITEREIHEHYTHMWSRYNRLWQECVKFGSSGQSRCVALKDTLDTLSLVMRHFAEQAGRQALIGKAAVVVVF